MSADYDIFIIGGGINGCGIARDAAGRGYSVYLCEQDDLASGTSSQSTKLIHGGLRYLEYFEFRLVREALTEREVLWRIAPHITHPLRFILPHHKGLRPAWLLRLGLFLYDHMDIRFKLQKKLANKLAKTTTLDLNKNPAGEPLQLAPNIPAKGFEYSDCSVDDARLVVLNALDANEKGASINTYTKCIDIQKIISDKHPPHWLLTVEDQVTKKQKKFTASVLVNAGGPWVDQILSRIQTATSQPNNIRLVQGSHIIVPKIYAHEKCYIFQNEDNRIIFAIPYQEAFTLIGTTDQDFSGDPHNAKITQTEIDYLLKSINAYFKKTTLQNDIVSSFSGVRSLYNDGASKAQAATRDYVIRADQATDQDPPLLNIFGGKITTYRHLAESVLKKVEAFIPVKKEKWTEASPLPGGNFAIDDFDKQCKALRATFDFLSQKEVTGLFKRYGTRTNQLLKNTHSRDDLGEHFGHGLYQKEVEYLIQVEWANSTDDILWRRTKLGLFFNEDETQKLTQWLKTRSTKQPA